jgi:hypothetical protein
MLPRQKSAAVLSPQRRCIRNPVPVPHLGKGIKGCSDAIP